MDNNLPVNDNQKPVTPVEPPPPTESPSVITETPEETPIEKTAEPTIEIGSLGQPSLSTIQDFGGKTNNKSKKIKSIVSVLGLLLIIIALPLAVVLVKQRQEIRKEAETPGLSGSVSLCGIKVSPTGQNPPGSGNYTFTYSITSTDGQPHTAEVHTYGCACTDGKRDSCGTESGQCDGKSFTINTPHTGTITAPKIGNCGTYQADVFILSVDGNSGCYTNK